MYYRIGTKDSLGNWDGLVNDFYADGEIQMRGSYNHGKRDGIFLYYSDHHTYTSAGRYQDDKRIGKWELFFNNGQLESEVYFRDRYFLKNLWDSTGHPLVRDGYGKVTTYYSNGVVKESGSYENGYKEGYWFGKFENGEMFFEENFFKGHLVRGRSQNLQHKKFIYDQSSLYPLPEGGYRALNNYLSDATKKSLAADSGIVRLVFRVTTIGRIVDVVVEKSVSSQCDSIAKELLRNGPAWTPSMKHGQIPFDSHTFVDVEFKKQL
jgi:antitoxin component YwqK of YwqJK toxin-antitoxin module